MPSRREAVVLADLKGAAQPGLPKLPPFRRRAARPDQRGQRVGQRRAAVPPVFAEQLHFDTDEEPDGLTQSYYTEMDEEGTSGGHRAQSQRSYVPPSGRI